jgi:hypothetical protein
VDRLHGGRHRPHRLPTGEIIAVPALQDGVDTEPLRMVGWNPIILRLLRLHYNIEGFLEVLKSLNCKTRRSLSERMQKNVLPCEKVRSSSCNSNTLKFDISPRNISSIISINLKDR